VVIKIFVQHLLSRPLGIMC